MTNMEYLQSAAEFLGPSSTEAYVLYMKKREGLDKLVRKYKAAADKSNLKQQTIEKIMEARTKSKDKKLESAVISKPKSKKLEVDRLMDIVRSMHS